MEQIHHPLKQRLLYVNRRWEKEGKWYLIPNSLLLIYRVCFANSTFKFKPIILKIKTNKKGKQKTNQQAQNINITLNFDLNISLTPRATIKKHFHDKIKEGTIVTQRLFHEIKTPGTSSLSIIKYHISTPPFYFDFVPKIKHNLLCYSNKMAPLRLHSFVSQLTIRKLLSLFEF